MNYFQHTHKQIFLTEGRLRWRKQ